jgi:hypothetical protein
MTDIQNLEKIRDLYHELADAFEIIGNSVVAEQYHDLAVSYDEVVNEKKAKNACRTATESD